MGISISTTRNRNRRNRRRGSFSSIFIFFGLFSLAIAAVFFILIHSEESEIPDDAIWYGATVSKVISVNVQDKLKTDDDGYKEKVTYYYSDVELQYEVNGTIYTKAYLHEDEDGALALGDAFYVSIIPSNPEVVYKVRQTLNEKTPKMILRISFVAGLGLLGLGIYMEIARKKSAIDRLEMNQNTSYNNGNGQYTYTQNDYSGTSLHD